MDQDHLKQDRKQYSYGLPIPKAYDDTIPQVAQQNISEKNTSMNANSNYTPNHHSQSNYSPFKSPYSQKYAQSQFINPPDSHTDPQHQVPQGKNQYSQNHNDVQYLLQPTSAMVIHQEEQEQMPQAADQSQAGNYQEDTPASKYMQFNQAVNQNQISNQIISNPPLSYDYNRGRELLTLTVDLGEEGHQNIMIYQNDKPEQIAYEFCKKNNIDKKLQDLLINHIAINMDQVKSQLIKSDQQQQYQQQQQKQVQQYNEEEYKESQEMNDVAEQGGGVNNHYSFMDEENMQGVQGSDSAVQINQEMIKMNLNDQQYQQKQQLIKRAPKSERVFTTTTGLVDITYCQMLYQRGLKRREEKQRLSKEQQRIKQQKELEGVTFHPKIKKSSKNFIRYQLNKTQDELYERHRKYKRKIEQKKLEKQLNEIKQCKFQPQINSRSAVLAQERSKKFNNLSSNDIQDALGATDSNKTIMHCDNKKFDLLYSEAQNKQKRMKQINKRPPTGCTFTPNISEVSRKKADKQQGSLYDRLQKTVNLQFLKSKYVQKVDPKTGQQFFVPQINKGVPSSGKTPSAQDSIGLIEHQSDIGGEEQQKQEKRDPVGTRLHDQAKNHQQKIKSLQNDYSLGLKEKARKGYTSKQSNKIMEGKKRKKFLDIFKRLDSDMDYKISAKKVDIASISPNILEIITPLLCQMEDMNIEHDQTSFLDACDKLYYQLPHPDKLKLMNEECSLDTKQKKNSQNLFHPSLNSNSIKLIEKSMKKDQPVVSRLLQSKQAKDLRLSTKRTQKQDDDLQGCTFTPSIIRETPKSLKLKVVPYYQQKKISQQKDQHQDAQAEKFDLQLN